MNNHKVCVIPNDNSLTTHYRPDQIDTEINDGRKVFSIPELDQGLDVHFYTYEGDIDYVVEETLHESEELLR